SRDGTPADPSQAEAIPLTGDIVYQDGFNVNGIDATPNGRTLVIVQSNTGKLFTVDPSSGVTSEIDLESEDVTNGDGILLDGRDLYVVLNFDNLLAKVRLAPGLSAGQVVSRTGDEDFDVPTTVAEAGNVLYLVNARFNTPPGPDTEYWIAPIRKP
ncbi:MAG TPA: superoxide dismutase, partial [Actinomycetota bacterium]|nr:superoxide dismutase [Actinomycetota bacterium]